MLTKLGISIAGAAVTTAGSCIFLFFCHIFLFLQLGVMLFANCIIAVIFSLFFLSALMMVAGPLGKCGEIGDTLTCGCIRRRGESGGNGEKKKQSITAVVPISNGADDDAAAANARNWGGDENKGKKRGDKSDIDKRAQESWDI
jgi:hypothetical protein